MKLSLPSCVRGHHIYKQLWTPIIGQVLLCKRETSNTEDCFAVAEQRQYLERGLLSAMCLEEFRQPVLCFCAEKIRLSTVLFS